MNTDTNTLDTSTIDNSVAEIESAAAARVFIQTIISQFQARYTIENPGNVQQSVKPVVHALQSLQKKGFDMKPYADQLVSIAAREYESYKGNKDIRAHQSTLIVTDHVMHKKGTGYWKKEDKKV